MNTDTFYTFTYDPFGNKVSSTLPDNTATGSTYGWVGQHEKLNETAFTLAPTQMGARIYLSSIGRFLQVDPVEGGVENNYVYPPDPINEYDLTGEAVFVPIAIFVGRIAVKQAIKHAPTIYRSVRSAKTAKQVEKLGKYTKTTWSVGARNVGGAARAVYTKYKLNGSTKRVVKDTYNVHNKLMHRKYKLWWRR